MKKNSSQKKYLIPISVFLIGVLFSLNVFFISRRVEEKRLRVLFERLSNDRSSSIINEFNDHLIFLYATRGLFYASEKVERKEFRKFARGILLHQFDIIDLEWIPRVKDTDRDKFEKNIIKEGFKSSRLTNTTTTVFWQKRHSKQNISLFIILSLLRKTTLFLDTMLLLI